MPPRSSCRRPSAGTGRRIPSFSSPRPPLAASTTYTATVKGGTGGVTDVAGNPLCRRLHWTFTTRGSGRVPSAGWYAGDMHVHRSCGGVARERHQLLRQDGGQRPGRDLPAGRHGQRRGPGRDDGPPARDRAGRCRSRRPAASSTGTPSGTGTPRTPSTRTRRSAATSSPSGSTRRSRSGRSTRTRSSSGSHQQNGIARLRAHAVPGRRHPAGAQLLHAARVPGRGRPGLRRLHLGGRERQRLRDPTPTTGCSTPGSGPGFAAGTDYPCGVSRSGRSSPTSRWRAAR